MKNELVKILVDAGLEKKEATKKVDELYKKVKSVRPEDPDDKVWAIVRLKVKQFAQSIKRSGAKAYKGIVLGFSDYRDVFAGIKRAILDEYEKNPSAAIAQGMVRVEADGTIIPLDTRTTLPSGDPNPNFGKPVPTINRRDIFMAIDGQLFQVYGDIADDPEIGGLYTFAGSERENSVIALSRIRPFTKEGNVSEDELWETALSTLEDKAVPLTELADWHEQNANNAARMAAIRGVVTFTTDTSTGNTLVVVEDLDDPTGDGIPVFADPAKIAGLVETGVEVVAFGRTFQSPVTNEEGDTELRTGIAGFGIIPNPETMTFASLYKELDEVLWDQ